MDCDTCLDGKVIGIEELTNYVLLRVDFGKWKNTYKLKKSECDLSQLLHLVIGAKVTCLFSGTDNLVRVFVSPPLYSKKIRRFLSLKKLKFKPKS